jgi:predicted GH43/DUF377 family glycosyl hydrolase
MVSEGNVSRIGSFRARELQNGEVVFEQQGYALEPRAPYELRNQGDGCGCEDPRVTFIAALDLFVMAYVAFGPRGPEVALAISDDGLAWNRLGLMRFGSNTTALADKDAAFFPEPVRSPAGEWSLAFYHRPSNWQSHSLPPSDGDPGPREGIHIGYVPVETVRNDIARLCETVETYRLPVPAAPWGRLKLGAGTPPVRIREGWLSIIHGVDLIEQHNQPMFAMYCAGVIIHDLERPDRLVYRSQAPLFVADDDETPSGAVKHVVFPSALDHPQGFDERTYELYYGICDDRIGRGRITLPP